MIAVLATGPLATIQDVGRPGRARLGISPSGAADRRSLALGNRLVGNPAEAAGIEVTMGGLTLRADRPLIVALTGADARAEVDGRPVGPNATIAIGAGGVLALGTPTAGLRTYVAVRGGIDVPPVLGSRSFDTLARLGPTPLTDGDRLPVGQPTGPLPDADWAAPRPLTTSPVTVGCRYGPRHEWFIAPPALLAATWTVSGDLDRIGVRLSGPLLHRAVGAELPSEGLVRGAVQVPPAGQPLVFLADHPTTGGYPVIAVVDDADTDVIAQLRPGQRLRFRLV